MRASIGFVLLPLIMLFIPLFAFPVTWSDDFDSYEPRHDLDEYPAWEKYGGSLYTDGQIYQVFVSSFLPATYGTSIYIAVGGLKLRDMMVSETITVNEGSPISAGTGGGVITRYSGSGYYSAKVYIYCDYHQNPLKWWTMLEIYCSSTKLASLEIQKDNYIYSGDISLWVFGTNPTYIIASANGAYLTYVDDTYNLPEGYGGIYDYNTFDQIYHDNFKEEYTEYSAYPTRLPYSLNTIIENTSIGSLKALFK